jgi:hypothetical protein
MLKMMDGSPNDAVHHDRYAGHDHSGPGAMRHAGHQDHERG